MPRPELASALIAIVTPWGPRGQPLPVHTEKKAEDTLAASGPSEARCPVSGPGFMRSGAGS